MAETNALDGIKLTVLETKVLRALYESAAGNGHDFGFTDEHGLESKRQASGVISGLAKKGILSSQKNAGEVSGSGSQFTWKHPHRDVNALIMRFEKDYADEAAAEEERVRESLERQLGPATVEGEVQALRAELETKNAMLEKAHADLRAIAADLVAERAAHAATISGYQADSRDASSTFRAVAREKADLERRVADLVAQVKALESTPAAAAFDARLLAVAAKFAGEQAAKAVEIALRSKLTPPDPEAEKARIERMNGNAGKVRQIDLSHEEATSPSVTVNGTEIALPVQKAEPQPAPVVTVAPPAPAPRVTGLKKCPSCGRFAMGNHSCK
jgi:hypothetical protein